MKYLIELVADPKGLEPAITAMEELNAKEKELKSTTTSLSAEQKKLMDSYAANAKVARPELDKMIQGYKQLGKAATGAFSKDAINGAAKAAESFRTQLRNSREEVTKLFMSGKATTAQIYEAARAGGQLKDSIGDAQQAISVLASDTFRFDAAIQGIQVGAAGFQALTAGAALFGEESEDLQRTLVKLNAIMALTQSLQQIVNLTQKQSAFMLGLNVAAQKTYALAVGQTTGALRIFRLAASAALAATGVGLILVLIANWKEFTNWIGLSGEKLDKLKDTFSGLTSAAKQFFVSIGDVIKSLLDGDFSQLYAKAKEIGKKTADAYSAGFNSGAKARALKDFEEAAEFSIRIARAQGDELKALQLEAELARKRFKASKDKDDKEAQDALIAVLEADKALKDFYAEKEKERLDEIKRKREEIAKKEAEIRDKLSKENEDAFKAQQERIKKNGDSFIETEKLKQAAAIETNKLLQEQYDELARLNADNLQKLREQLDFENSIKEDAYQNDIQASIDKENAIRDATIQISQQTFDAIFQIANSNRNIEFNAQIQRLNELRDRELTNKELTDTQRARIEERYQRKVAELKAKQAQADKQAAIAQAIINGALAITKIFTSVTALNPASFAAIAITAATTAAQIAIISAQKIPKFAKGTEFVQGAGTETSDSVPAMLSRGERVIDAKTNKLLKGIPNKLIPDLLIPQATMIKEGMDYDKLAKAFSKELANNPTLMVNFDKQGFTTFIKSGVTTSQIKNNRNGI